MPRRNRRTTGSLASLPPPSLSLSVSLSLSLSLFVSIYLSLSIYAVSLCSLLWPLLLGYRVSLKQGVSFTLALVALFASCPRFYPSLIFYVFSSPVLWYTYARFIYFSLFYSYAGFLCVQISSISFPRSCPPHLLHPFSSSPIPLPPPRTRARLLSTSCRPTSATP